MHRLWMKKVMEPLELFQVIKFSNIDHIRYGIFKGIQNPITLAWTLLHTQKQGLMNGGRIPPW